MNINEPSEEETIDILNNIKGKYEKYHKVKIEDLAISEAVRLGVRYIPDKNLPDKAIDIIDEACSKVKNENVKNNYNVQDEALLFKQKLLELKENKIDKKQIIITEKDIAEVVSRWVKIPMEKLENKDKEKLKNLEKRLREKIIGQDIAVEALAKSIKRNRAGMRDPRRPIASFLFTGPTGVGKTELVKVLASEIFDNEKNLIRVDMSEYMEKHSVSKMIGSPPGYVGFNEGGQLTEKVRKMPYSIVLFDEIEKAHEDVYNILLQILDDGRVTDSLGRVVSFKNTICIMTSNIGARNITEDTKVGFIKQENIQDEYIKIKSEVMKEVNKKFSPEFLNRLDDIIIFNRLDEISIKKITRLLLKDVESRAKLQGLKVKFENSAVEYIARIGYDSKKGARPIKRAIQNNIENKFADYVIEHKIDNNKDIVVYFSNRFKDIRIKQGLNKRKKEVVK